MHTFSVYNLKNGIPDNALLANIEFYPEVERYGSERHDTEHHVTKRSVRKYKC